jgi:8-oxo-dGTP pyrophosphatase MutT (NUDIX family)
VVRIDEYYRSPHPPPVSGLAVVAYAVVRDRRGQVLLVRRVDDGNWELPGGRVEVGETLSATVVREVAEESGVTVGLTGVSGVYSDPEHIVVYVAEGALQQFAVCLHAAPEPPDQIPEPDDVETVDAAWFPPAATAGLPMHPDVRRRLLDALDRPERTHVD